MGQNIGSNKMHTSAKFSIGIVQEEQNMGNNMMHISDEFFIGIVPLGQNIGSNKMHTSAEVPSGRNISEYISIQAH